MTTPKVIWMGEEHGAHYRLVLIPMPSGQDLVVEELSGFDTLGVPQWQDTLVVPTIIVKEFALLLEDLHAHYEKTDPTGSSGSGPQVTPEAV